MENKLKPCPFCGEEVYPMFVDDTGHEYVYENDNESIDFFKCFGCDTEFSHNEPKDSPQKQINWWNSRNR